MSKLSRKDELIEEVGKLAGVKNEDWWPVEVFLGRLSITVLINIRDHLKVQTTRS